MSTPTSKFNLQKAPNLDYSAAVLADSISEAGARLTTMEVTIPRFVLAEFNTHRVFSRNSASSRAIRVSTNAWRVLTSPYVPRRFGMNQPGMQSSQHITPKDGEKYKMAVQAWLQARDSAVVAVVSLLCGPRIAGALQLTIDKTGQLSIEDTMRALEEYDDRLKNNDLLPEYLNVHKQLANRLIENWTWQVIIVSSTEWTNMLALREHFDAQDEISIPTTMMREALEASTPTLVRPGEYHLPLIQEDEKDLVAAAYDNDTIEQWIKISVGRCARASYLTHHGVRDINADIRLYERLEAGGHMSPMEHVATPSEDATTQSGNFVGWEQHRKTIKGENDYSLILAQK